VPDAFEQWLSSLVESGAMVPPPDATPAEMVRFREWAADIWLSWRRYDILNPHEADVDFARAQIDSEWREAFDDGDLP
jgi:hypothetical protein